MTGENWKSGFPKTTKETYQIQTDRYVAQFNRYPDEDVAAKVLFCNSADAAFNDDPKMMIESLRIGIKNGIERRKRNEESVSKMFLTDIDTMVRMFVSKAEEGDHYIP